MRAKGYISSRALNNGITYDQNIQNLIIRNYFENNNYFFLLSSTEFIMKNSFKMLYQLLHDCNEYDSIVFFSYHQLPKPTVIKKDLVNLINKKKKICFAYENIIINNIIDLNNLNNEINISKLLKYSPKKI